MRAKKVKRKCGVRGCRNTDTYSISLTREAGNSIIICRDCLEKAIDAIDNVKEEPETRVSYSEAPPLFFNSVRPENEPGTLVPDGVQDEQIPTDENPPVSESDTPDGSDNPPSESSEFVCPHCGQVCKSELGLQRHIEAKHKDLA